MTVKELIRQLEKIDPALEVKFVGPIPNYLPVPILGAQVILKIETSDSERKGVSIPQGDYLLLY